MKTKTTGLPGIKELTVLRVAGETLQVIGRERYSDRQVGWQGGREAGRQERVIEDVK